MVVLAVFSLFCAGVTLIILAILYIVGYFRKGRSFIFARDMVPCQCPTDEDGPGAYVIYGSFVWFFN
jgi:hypothetical protein